MAREKKKARSFSVDADQKIAKLSDELRLLRRKYKQSLQDLKSKDVMIDSFKESDIETYQIRLKSGNTNSEATAFMIASDWHCDEVVRPATVSGLNKFNEKIARQRADKFFQNGVTLLKMSQRDTKIKTLVLALLGDFISSNIHEELLRSTHMAPITGLLFAQSMITSGINYLLKHTDVDIIVPCSVGNHSRITRQVHVSNELGNSLEYSMYYNIAEYFRHEKRVTFLIGEGYHSYLKVYGKTIRFAHGHSIRYGGGVGGIYIPANKAIAQWNKGKRADLDVFGHFHQMKDGGIFVSNGSLIGWSPYAVTIKADYEKPKQTFFLWDKQRGKTIVTPIFLE